MIINGALLNIDFRFNFLIFTLFQAIELYRQNKQLDV